MTASPSVRRSAPSRQSTSPARKREWILRHATAEFMAHGFHGASIDGIAAAAKVSKPTVYKYFGNKEQLFAAILQAAAADILHPIQGTGTRSTSLRDDLIAFARHYAAVILSPVTLTLHRLAIAEAQRFPELGQLYYEAGPGVAVSGLAAYLERLARAGELELDDPELAAHHFWSLVLSAPRTLMLFKTDKGPSAKEIDRFVVSGVDVFLGHYGSRNGNRRRSLPRPRRVDRRSAERSRS
jgi:TetR/AcrR family transcriptional regulator, mexJK operon transcriptional repressor